MSTGKRTDLSCILKEDRNCLIYHGELRSKIGGTLVNKPCFNFFWEQLFKTAFEETFSPVFPLYVRVAYATFAALSFDRLL